MSTIASRTFTRNREERAEKLLFIHPDLFGQPVVRGGKKGEEEVGGDNGEEGRAQEEGRG